MPQGIDTVESTRLFYGRYGDRYEGQTRVLKQRVAYPHLVASCKSCLGSLEGTSLLDAGCGRGELFPFLEREGAAVRGIDFALASVEAGRALGRDITRGDLRDLPYPDRQFDGVLSFHSLNNLPHAEQQGALQEQWRVLKPGGYIVLAGFPLADDAPSGSIRIQAFPDLPEDAPAPWLYGCTREHIHQLLRDAGFGSIGYSLEYVPGSLRDGIADTDADALYLLDKLAGLPYAFFVTARKP